VRIPYKEEKSQVKLIRRYLPLVLAGAFAVPFASAQSTFDINMGFGAVQDSAAKGGIDNTTLLGCAIGSSTTCVSTPSLSSFMLGFGGNLMLWKRFGVGAEVNFQPAKQNYLSLPTAGTGLTSDVIQSRATFYDFNGIFVPVRSKKASLQLSGGIGGMNLKFYENQSATTAITGNQNFSQYFASSNHFQVHGGVGVQVYLTDHFFVRPQFDVHWVNNLSQFGRSTPIVAQVWVGYSFGGQ
jgi:Outer membrane protein beta-barrel domain